MRFSCSPDNITRTITIILFFVFGGISLLQINILFYQKDENLLFSISMLVLFTSVLIFAWIFSPRAYVVEDECLVIKRLARDYLIQRNEIRLSRILSNEEMKNTWRTLGNGGLFGVYGKFKNSTFGDMTYYAKRNSDLVLVELISGKKIILSPDDREGFVKELNRKK